jgi:hypothetical protein
MEDRPITWLPPAQDSTANEDKREHTWCGYEVPGTILLRDSKGAMRLDRSKDTSVHVSTCTNYDVKASNARCVEAEALMTRLCFSSQKRVVGLFFSSPPRPNRQPPSE